MIFSLSFTGRIFCSNLAQLINKNNRCLLKQSNIFDWDRTSPTSLKYYLDFVKRAFKYANDRKTKIKRNVLVFKAPSQIDDTHE